ncbi:MAG: protein kinase [Pyrinomonadaceae bacterium]|nr:protein kinase [Pyrinomonadaceae bacterium]
MSEKIGRYEIKKLLGKGGMGEVFLAHDTSLDREVAIKVLLPEFCCNLERVNRFKLEARAASALNHPNIITIYEIGNDEDKLFISTEFIKGETLRSLIERKVLDLSASLNIAEQVASALTSAHQAGIIHRDIKPENIMIRADGIVKVLDFGLAKPTMVESEAETRELVSTKAGVVMGSVGYMSPEQSRGKEVDNRTDLWSLGVVLYEMLTGKTPFDDETMTDILANIIHKEPLPIGEKVSDCPIELSRIIKKSLRKDREERYQTAKDFQIDLKNLRREMELEHELELSISPSKRHEFLSKSIETTNKNKFESTDEVNETKILSNPLETQTSQEVIDTPLPKKRVSMVLIAVLGIAFLAGLWAISYFTWQKPKMVNSFTNVTFEKLPIKKNVSGVEFSPDGKYLAYVEGSQGSNTKIVLRQTQTGSEKDIVPFVNSNIALIGFSPDSNYIYFRKGQKAGIGAALFRVPILGGEPKQIAFDVDSGVSFSPDGSQIVFHRHIISPAKDEIFIIPSDGGEEKLIYTNTDNQTHPQFSPDGKVIILSGVDISKKGTASHYLGWISADGSGNFQRLGNTLFESVDDYRWLKDGSGLLVSGVLAKENNRRLFTMSFPDGNIQKITKDTNDYGGNSITADGKSIVVVQSTTTSGIWEFDLNSKIAKQIIKTSEDLKGYSGLVTTTDNKLFYTKFDGKDNVDIWKMNNDGSSESLFLGGKGENRPRAVSSDGSFIIIDSVRDGIQEFRRINTDGTNEVQITNSPDYNKTFSGISPDNKFIIYKQESINGSESKLIKHDLETNQTTTIWQDEKTYLQNANLSPDGKYLLFASAPITFENGIISQASLFIADFDGTSLSGTKVLKKVADTRAIRFSPDSKFLYYIESENEGSDIWRMNLSDAKATKITNFNLESIFRFSVSPDNKKIYVVRGTNTREVVLIKTEASKH